MALETLRHYVAFNGEKVLQERIKNTDGIIDWDATDEARKQAPIFIDHDVNMISFRIQNGPIKEVGKNGCQLTELIAVAGAMLEGLNEKFPCEENKESLYHIKEALAWQEVRTKNREARGVEGKSEL